MNFQDIKKINDVEVLILLHVSIEICQISNKKERKSFVFAFQNSKMSLISIGCSHEKRRKLIKDSMKKNDEHSY